MVASWRVAAAHRDLRLGDRDAPSLRLGWIAALQYLQDPVIAIRVRAVKTAWVAHHEEWQTQLRLGPSMRLFDPSTAVEPCDGIVETDVGGADARPILGFRVVVGLVRRRCGR